MKFYKLFLIILSISIPLFGQSTFVPDDNFEQALIDLGYDDILDDFVQTIKIYSITELEIEDRNIEDLTGISDFTNLQILRCMYNQLTVLDLSQNTALLELEVGENQLDTLDLSNNTDLITLYAWENNLQSIDLTHNTKLEFLDIGNNPLTNLDVSQNELLVGLETWGINLTSLDVSNNDSLRYLHIGDCQLEELNISSNVFLEELSIFNNNIQELDISNNTKLYWLDVTYNNLTALDVSENTELEYLYAWEANLSELNISNNPNLRELGCGWNQLSSLDISNSINLETLWCANNQLTVLDLSANTNLHNLGFESNLISSINLDNNNQLRELWCGYNQLTELNLTEKVNLEYVDISGNNIEDFEYTTLSNLVYLGMERTGISGDHDFSNHPSLHELFISYNNISSVTLNNPDLRYFVADSADLVSIDFSNSPLLEAVSVHGNNLTSLDLSEKSSLYYLNCGFNNLFEINLKHGSEQFEEFWADGNQNLGCILVSDVDYHAERFNAENGMIDEGVIFDEDCAISLEQLASKWKIASEPGALKVGPNFLGDLWWANSEYDIEDRGCYFDDKYVLHPDGQFENIFFGETWLEEWQTDTTDSAESFNYCGEPISPHNGMNTSSWSYDSTAKKITVYSVGAFIGLPKVFNGGELTQEGSVPPDSIKYDIVSMGEGVMSLSINIGSGYWTFKMIESLNEPPIFSSEPNDSVHAGSEYNYPITIIDENIDSVFIQIEELPHWLSLVEGPDGMSLIGIPFADDIGVHEVTLIVFDLDGESSSQNFSIVVYNYSPIAFDQSYIIAEDEGAAIELAVNDLDQDQIEYFIQNSPSNGILELDEERNTSLHFDGDGDYVNVGDLGDYSPVSYAIGFKPSEDIMGNLNEEQYLISKDGDGQWTFRLVIRSNGTIGLGIGGVGDEASWVHTQRDTWHADTWYHIVATINNDLTMSIYVDGIKEGETGSSQNIQENGYNTYIGTGVYAGDGWFSGNILYAGIWDEALTDNQIQELMFENINNEGLQGFWFFDYDQGAFVEDISNNNFGGTVNGATWEIEDGSSGGSEFLYFDGVDDNVTIEIDEQITEKTLSAWVKLSTLEQGGGGLISLQTSGGGIFDAIVYNETNQGWGFGSDGFSRTEWSNINETSTDWIYMTATYDHYNYKLYRNGELILNTTSFSVQSFPSNAQILVGERHTGGGNNWLNADIKDVELWNRSLNQEEIQSNMELPNGDEDGLVGLWLFDEGEGDIVHDYTPNQYHGMINGATWDIEEGSNESSNFTYVPYNNFHGEDFFTYVAFDGFDYSELATVTIEVTEVNDAPQAFGEYHVIGEDDTLHADLHAEDGDYFPTQQHMQYITYSITSYVMHGDLMVNDTSGAFMYTPHPNFFGADSFYFAVTDNGTTNGVDDFLSDTAMVHIFVEPINDAPVLSEFADTSMVEDSSLVLSVFASDIDNSDLSVYAYSSEEAVMAYVEDTLLYISTEENWNGSAEIIVVANDNMSRATDVEQFMLTITAVNDAPFFTMEEFSAAGDITAGVDTWVHADDIDSDIFFFLEGAPSWLMMDGSRMVGQPDQDSVYVFTLSVSDSEYVVSESFELTIVDHRPHVISLTDVPQDQGRQMKLLWEPGHMDEAGYFTQFSIWREVPTDTADLWDFITSVPWIGGEDDYSRIVPTLGDSTVDTTYYSTFRVTAHTEDVDFYHDSEPVTGYSIDNLHPSVPQGLMAVQSGASVILQWLSAEDEDFNYHNVYRSDLDSVDPAMVFTTSDSFYVDLEMAAGSWEYWITSVDSAGNESDASEPVSVLLSNEQELAIPTVYALQQNYPNPFNPSTQIRYALPEDAMVTISIYDMMGRKVRTLVNQSMSPGYHTTLWNATNDRGLTVGAGMYIYTIQAGTYHHMKKMVLLK